MGGVLAEKSGQFGGETPLDPPHDFTHTHKPQTQTHPPITTDTTVTTTTTRTTTRRALFRRRLPTLSTLLQPRPPLTRAHPPHSPHNTQRLYHDKVLHPRGWRRCRPPQHLSLATVGSQPAHLAGRPSIFPTPWRVPLSFQETFGRDQWWWPLCVDGRDGRRGRIAHVRWHDPGQGVSFEHGRGRCQQTHGRGQYLHVQLWHQQHRQQQHLTTSRPTTADTRPKQTHDVLFLWH